MRTGAAIICLFLTAAPLALRSQSQGDYILIARRSPVAELVDAATLQTVTRIHFDFLAERISGMPGSPAVKVDGYQKGGSCCKHYLLNLATQQLTEDPPLNSPGYALVSPDGLWRYELRSFRGPALEAFNLKDHGPSRRLIPPGLPPEDQSGNWYASGTWSADRFYLYIQRPDHPGFLWTVLPGTESLGAGVAVSAFNEVPNCFRPMPATRGILASGDNLILYEPFGNRLASSRHCEGIPGGAWFVDPSTGRLTKQIAPEFHFASLIPDDLQPVLYATALAGKDSIGEPEQLLRLNAQDGAVMKSRVMGPGESLVISASRLTGVPSGDITVKVTAP